MIALLKALFGVGAPQVSPRDAVQRMNRGAALVDVREAGEFAAGHVRGACHIPLGDLRAGGPALLDARLPAATTEILLICQSGMRSRLAQSGLAGKDARTYLNIAGGMSAWRAHGLPVSRQG